jgi:hypothetical protein
MALSDREIISIVDGEFEDAMGAPNGDISKERALAYDFYNSRPLGNEIAGKSQVVTSDVAEVVDGIMPSLMRMFATDENLVSFDPVNQEDERLAQQETDYTTYLFFRKNKDAFMTLHNWFFDALLQKNGYVKAYFDNSEIITEETYKGLTEDEALALLSDEELEPIERDERTTETVINNQLVRVTLHDIRFKRTSTSGRIRVENVPPEEFRISSDATKVDPDEARMVGHERLVSRSDLIAMGFDADIVMNLPAKGYEHDSEEKIARRGLDDQREGYSDPSQVEVEVREAYVKLDVNQDGKSELRQIFISNGQLLSNEPADRQPFHALCSKPLPHKHFGTCPAEMVMDIQEVTTTLTRQILDNLYQTNNPGHAVYEQAIGETTLDDLMTTEVGRIAIFDRPIGESYAPMTVPFTAGQSFPMLNRYEQVKQDRTGVTSASDMLDPEALKKVQQSVMTQSMDIANGKIEMIARIFAESGIKSLFLHMHELIRKHVDKVEVAKLRGEWVEVDPSSWRDRLDVSVNIGIGMGSRQSNLMHLTAIQGLQAQLAATDGLNMTVTPKNIYNTAAEIVRNANLKDPTKYFTDPGDQLAPPPNQEMIAVQQQQNQIAQAQLNLAQEKQAIDRTRVEVRAQQEQMRMMLEHQREITRLQQSKERDDDQTKIAIEKLHQELIKMELDFKTDIAPADFTYNPLTGELTDREQPET